MQTEDTSNEGSKKRPIAVDSQDSPPRKRLDRRSAHEKRLAGDYSVPNTAVPLHSYGKLDSDDPESRSRPRTTMQHKPGAGSRHKFGNTLNQASPHVGSARNTVSANFMSTNKTILKPMTTGQSMVLTQARSSYGDGFEHHERGRDAPDQRPTKKLKLEVKPGDTTTDEDDLIPGEVIGVNNKGLPGNTEDSQVNHVSNRESQYFRTIEFEHVNSMSSTQVAKKKRKSKDGRASSQASSREVLAEASNGHADVSESAVREVLKQELVGDQERAKTDLTRPEIDLTKGFDDIKSFFTKPSANEKDGTLVEVQEPSGNLTNSRARPGQLQRPSVGPRQSMLRTAAIKKSIPPFGSSNLRGDGSSNLRDKFTRDMEPPWQQRAPERMKATSRTTGVRVSDVSNDSDDVLNGQPTVGSRASGSVSPQKNAQSRVAQSSGATHRRKSLSPGNLRPTQFRSSVRSSQYEDKRAGNVADLKKTNEGTKVRIRAFYATSIILEAGDLILEYDEREKQFDLHCNGCLQVLRGKQKAISIGESEVHTITYSRNSHRVYLQGPNCSIGSGNVSNGHICITFMGADGVEWFMDQFMAATEDRLKLDEVLEDRLNKIFILQISAIRMWNAKQIVQDANAESNAIARAKRGDGLDEDGIQYGSGSASHKRSGPLFQKSQYFHNAHEDLHPRRSSRQTRQIKRLSPTPEPVQKWTQVNKPQRWSSSVVYPPEGQRRVTVDFQDLERLDEGEFLNDNIISFALRRIEETMSPEHKDDVFFFNSFFYTALTSKTSKNGHKSFDYDAVKRWTKNKDIFTLPYVVVPINIDLHWFVAIICNLPSVSHKPSGLDDENEEDQIHDGEAQKISSSLAVVDGETVGILAENGGATSHPERTPSSRTLDGEAGEEVQAQTTAMRHLSISQEHEETKAKPATGADEDPIADDPDVEVIARSHGKFAGPKKSKRKAPPPPKKYNPDRPTIITLDSFGSSHATETRNLKDYLKAEAEAKRSMELDIKELQGMTAKGIPEQTNFCDCGLYLVGYVEKFAKDPRQFVTKVLTRQLDREADFASFNPSAKRDEIRSELLQLYEEQQTSRKGKKSTKKTSAKGLAEPPASSPTPALATDAKQESEAPAVNGTVEEMPINVSKQQKLSTNPKSGPHRPVEAAEEDELSEEVPRALPGPAVRKIENSSPPPAYPLQSHEEHDALTSHRPSDECSLATNVQAIGKTRMADIEEMLDSPDVPMDDSSGMFSDAADGGQDGDILSSLEQAIKPSNDTLEDTAARANIEDASGGKLRKPRQRKRNTSTMVVIDLEADSQLEIPESPVERQHALQPQFIGKHTKFD